MAQNLAALREELSTFLSMKYDEGLLERDTFEQFLGLQEPKDHKKEEFSMVADLLTIICKDKERIIAEIYPYARSVFNVVKVEGLVHELNGISKR
ncbi:hypothetical protein MKX01_031905 [Papaver californicum]|nr:hypothetical protein MKX01_031905 [Papaver californicum]